MTGVSEDRSERERRVAQVMMDNLRQRGLIVERPAPTTIGDLTTGGAALALIPPRPAQAHYATPEQLHSWQSDPGLLNGSLHVQHCQSGDIIVLGPDGEIQSAACPHCKAQAREAELRRRLMASNIDGRYLDPNWEDLEQPAPLDRLAVSCGHITAILDIGESLMLWSQDTGSGKTQAAMLAAKAAIRAGRTAHVENLARLALEVRDGYRDKSDSALSEGAALTRLTSPDLLVIDDLGAGETDSAAVERRLLYLALDFRQMHRKSTIVTSNLNPREIVELLGSRVVSRLQPLEIIHVNHGRNFRVPRNHKSLW